MATRRDLASTNVAVTGGAQGIGLAIAEALVARGAHVVIGDLDAELATRTAEELGDHVVASALDVTDHESFSAFLSYADEAFAGGLHVLVNNAGIMPIGAFLDESDDLTDKAISVDLGGVITGTKLAGRLFRQRGDGHVVNIASVMGTLASPHAAAYCAAKFGVVGLGQALRQEWRGTGVGITTICPGFVRTGLIAGMSAPRGTEWAMVVDPEHVAEAVVRAVVRDKSRTVFVPKAVGALSNTTGAMPVGFRDWLFRISGSNRVTSDLDASARADYQASMEGGDR